MATSTSASPILQPFDELFRFVLGRPDLQGWVGKQNKAELYDLLADYKPEHDSKRRHERYAHFAARLIGILSKVRASSTLRALSKQEKHEYDQLHEACKDAINKYGATG